MCGAEVAPPKPPVRLRVDGVLNTPGGLVAAIMDNLDGLAPEDAARAWAFYDAVAESNRPDATVTEITSYELNPETGEHFLDLVFPRTNIGSDS